MQPARATMSWRVCSSHRVGVHSNTQLQVQVVIVPSEALEGRSEPRESGPDATIPLPSPSWGCTCGLVGTPSHQLAEEEKMGPGSQTGLPNMETLPPGAGGQPLPWDIYKGQQ